MKTFKNLFCICLLAVSTGCFSQGAAKKSPAGFKKTTLTNEFLSEGVAAGDINKDGKTDIVAGYYWFEAPSWKRHEIAPSRVFDPTKEYSNSFLNHCMDVNQDGWTDVVLIDFPGLTAMWFENPGKTGGAWKKNVIGNGGDSIGIANESPGFVDVDKDGRTDILCGDVSKKQIVWLRAPDKGQKEWTRYAISDLNAPGTERFSHGIGLGDINMDGRNDVFVTEGWWEAPADPKESGWRWNPVTLGDACSHMYAVDVNGDGKNDIVNASAHRLGMWWYEQYSGEQGEIEFRKHLISESVSQTHASILADLDGDGKNEWITGKRFLAHHGSNDPGTYDPSLLLYFELSPNEPYWVEKQIDNDSGAGLNIVAQDMNKDGKTDIVIANKKGVFLFENMLKQKKRSK